MCTFSVCLNLFKSYTSADGSSYAGTDLNLLALYPDLVIYKTGNIYQNLHFIILNSFCAYDMYKFLHHIPSNQSINLP